jgi:chromosome segregation ATPase
MDVNLYEDLPDFANQANRAKHALLLQKNAELAALTAECHELRDRYSVVSEHLKSCEFEITTTEQIVNAREEEVRVEHHLREVAFREKGKIQTDLSKISVQLSDILSKDSQIQTRILQSQDRINKLKDDARMNQHQLEQWVQAARDKEEDFAVLKRYQTEDEGRIRNFLNEIEKATALMQAKEAELDQEITTTRALQIELDTTAEQFRKMHGERAKLLEQWEVTLEKMQTLNHQIESTTETFERRKRDVLKYSKVVTDKQRDLEKVETGDRKSVV